MCNGFDLVIPEQFIFGISSVEFKKYFIPQQKAPFLKKALQLWGDLFLAVVRISMCDLMHPLNRGTAQELRQIGYFDSRPD